MIDIWFKEAIKVSPPHNFNGEVYVLYKGFKVGKNDSGYVLKDTRRNDFYCDPLDEDVSMFKEHGFIKGASLIKYRRDLKRINHYTRLMESLYQKKSEHQKELRKQNVSKEEKDKHRTQIRITKGHIQTNHDLLFFYKNKAEQIENKYNLNGKETKD